MEHERMRFKTMTQRQLYTRLGRIVHVDKLQKFILVAKEFGYASLAKTAQRKFEEMASPSGKEKTLYMVELEKARRERLRAQYFREKREIDKLREEEYKRRQEEEWGKREEEYKRKREEGVKWEKPKPVKKKVEHTILVEHKRLIEF
jgi:hypothetical protein